MQSEQGQLLPMLAVVLVAAALAAVAIGRVGVKAAEHARASAAADASALAAAAAIVVDKRGPGEPPSPEVVAAANAAANANGADVEAVTDDGDTVTVSVRLGTADARARAARGGSVVDAGLRAAIARAGQLLGRAVPVVRFRPDGLAFSVPASDVAALAAVAAGAGLCPATSSVAGEYEVCDPPVPGTIREAPQQPIRSGPDRGTPTRASPESKPVEE